MKKKICIFLTFLTIILAMAPCISVLAEETRKQSVLKTSKQIVALCNEYDNYSNSNDGDKIDNRLMVKTNDRIDEYGAVDSVYGFGYAILQYANEESAQSAKEKYETEGYTVDYDSVVIASSDVSTYANWSDEWAYEETDAVSALDYYKLKVKPNINIAVVDSGINYNHELFKNRVVRTNVDFSTDASGDEMDTSGHGTKVAGAIAKSTPSNVKLFGYKIFDKNSKGTSSEAVAALSYIKQLKNKPDIINCSFATGSLGTVIDELVDMGVTVVAAAGNDGKEVYKQPAIFDSVITVAAITPHGNAWTSSNYGSCVDISAPGVGVYTANFPGNNTYAQFAGTSMATPLVSAAAAYVLMEHRSYTPEQVKHELIATATPFKKSYCYYDRYGAGIVNFSNIINGTRCKEVTANYISGAYRDNISVELKCANSLVDIYYTTDGTLPTKENGTKYTEPFTVSESERVTAVAFARAGTPFKSKFTYLDYYILKDGESEYVIEKSGYSGIIKAYLGNETNLVVPDVVNGIVPTELGGNIFKNSNIESIVLPDTVTTIGDNAFYNTNLKSITANGICNLNKRCFYGCEQLADINFPDLRYIGTEALLDCKLLTQDLDLPFVNWVADKGLAGTYFKTINLPECTEVGASAFEGCTAQEIVLKKTTKLGAKAFYNCTNLETIYIPQATSFGGCSGCTNLKTVFAPTAKSINADIPSNATIYCTGRMTGITFPQEYSDYKCTIVSPEYTAGLAIANSYGYEDRYIHISSDEIAKDKGGQIRPRDNGLRFGFAFDEKSIGFDFKKYAQSIDYGFVYTFESLDDKNAFQINDYLRENNSKVFVKSSEKRNVDGTVSTYNAVFTNIPKDHLDDKISARAYVNIDGMYFYSPVITRSYSSVANAVLNDSTVSEEIKKEIENSLKNGTTQKPSLQNNHTIKKTRFTKK
ncbi:S8 family serine peptidase [uncultured Eubacterium sp.]|uniref:S8 family serine peptidase n=1 Tax=uncultured Eubacterium sp. TaxID=165185 RepID=UPI0025834C96|nr:S8 family serine peptidase [uncultured Eubacterium sp.]